MVFNLDLKRSSDRRCIPSTVTSRSCFRDLSTGWWSLESSCSSLCRGRWFWRVIASTRPSSSAQTQTEASALICHQITDKTLLRMKSLLSLSFNTDLQTGLSFTKWLQSHDLKGHQLTFTGEGRGHKVAAGFQVRPVLCAHCLYPIKRPKRSYLKKMIWSLKYLWNTK